MVVSVAVFARETAPRTQLLLRIILQALIILSAKDAENALPFVLLSLFIKIISFSPSTTFRWRRFFNVTESIVDILIKVFIYEPFKCIIV